MVESPAETATELREEMVEVLRHLNRAEMEEPDGEGLELHELHHFLTRGPYPHLSSEEVEQAVRVLVANGFTQVRGDPEYAWDRGRVLGTRFLITTEGKRYLLERLARVNRVE
jgi:hypothetical protein